MEIIYVRFLPYLAETAGAAITPIRLEPDDKKVNGCHIPSGARHSIIHLNIITKIVNRHAVAYGIKKQSGQVLFR
jgi:hypothetical protein